MPSKLGEQNASVNDKRGQVERKGKKRKHYTTVQIPAKNSKNYRVGICQKIKNVNISPALEGKVKYKERDGFPVSSKIEKNRLLRQGGSETYIFFY